MIVPPNPLTWPTGVPRTPASQRIKSPFRTSFEAAIGNVQTSLRLFGSDARMKIEDLVLSSDVHLLDRRPADPGVAAWFRMDGGVFAFAVDRFPTPEANIQAIHHIVEARRVELRYGGLAIVRQTFRAFAALPAPPSRDWWDVLGVKRTADIVTVERAWAALAKQHHPDRGGDALRMAEINRARDDARRSLS